ncbi:hypothetical protein [Bradyrhizobium glycinis]|uniref:hypothetical protein n=1 Tax=Bradyrhizobium glycinis TaxID=2751812 RepID=UPI001FEAEB2D|nr:hypothetical protein [Bradyrhizobium glycinis]
MISFQSIFFLFFGVPRFGMDHRQRQSRIALLLSNRRQDANLAIPDLKNGLVGIAVAIADSMRWSPLTATSSISSAIV